MKDRYKQRHLFFQHVSLTHLISQSFSPLQKMMYITWLPANMNDWGWLWGWWQKAVRTFPKTSIYSLNLHFPTRKSKFYHGLSLQWQLPWSSHDNCTSSWNGRKTLPKQLKAFGLSFSPKVFLRKGIKSLPSGTNQSSAPVSASCSYEQHLRWWDKQMESELFLVIWDKRDKCIILVLAVGFWFLCSVNLFKL